MALSAVFRRTLPLLVIALSIYLAYSILNTQPAATKGKAKKAPRLSVVSQILMPGQFTISVNTFGTVQARTNSELFSLVSGQIIAISPVFESGAFFKQGDVLLEIETADYEVALQVSKGNVVSAELALAEEEARYDQARRDWKKQKTTATDFALRVPQLKVAKANLKTAKAQLSLAQLNLKRTKVRAPYDGRVLKAFVDVGSVVGPAVKLADVYSTDAVDIRLPIASKDLQFVDLPEQAVKTGLPLPEVLIENKLVEPKEIWKGQVVRTEAKIDAASQQLYVVARIEHPFLENEESNKGLIKGSPAPSHPLKIGQYVSAQIQGKVLDNVISIPNSVIYQGSYVYTIENEKLQRRPVVILWSNQKVSLIKSGLKEGDELVTTLLGQVTSGTLVSRKDRKIKREKKP